MLGPSRILLLRVKKVGVGGVLGGLTCYWVCFAGETMQQAQLGEERRKPDPKLTFC